MTRADGHPWPLTSMNGCPLGGWAARVWLGMRLRIRSPAIKVILRPGCRWWERQEPCLALLCAVWSTPVICPSALTPCTCPLAPALLLVPPCPCRLALVLHPLPALTSACPCLLRGRLAGGITLYACGRRMTIPTPSKTFERLRERSR